MHPTAMIEIYGEVDLLSMVEEDHQNIRVRSPHHAGLVPPLDSLVKIQDDTAVRLLLV